MLLLLGFALIAGAGTAITPCILPVLPAVLSASATGGRRRPLGIVTGLAAAFTLTITLLASALGSVSSGLTRTIAIVVLVVFGLVLMIPEVAARVEAPLSRLARFGPKTRGNGFWSGLGVGAALGFVCLPCAGPILGAVISVSATAGVSLQLFLVGLFYSIGLSAMLLLYALGGRKLLDRVKRGARGPQVQRALGAVLIVTALALGFNLDTRLTEALASSGVTFLSNPTKGLEDSHAVQSRLRTDLGAKPKFESGHGAVLAGPATGGGGTGNRPNPALQGVATPKLENLGAAPAITGTQRWFNTPGGRPLQLASFRGKVVLLDFWTYTCINCIRTLPFLKALYARYHPAGLTIVGVHTPEFGFEHDAGNVRQAIASDGIRYPVAQDNDYTVWNSYGNQYWPAEYLIDGHGNVVHTHFGEGSYRESEAAVRQALVDAGVRRLPAPITAKPVIPTALATPETYLGTARAERFLPRTQRNGTRFYSGWSGKLPLSHFALAGTWKVTPESATAESPAEIAAEVQARDVYLVLSSQGERPRKVQVSLDGRHTGTVTVRRQRLYHLVHLPRSERHRLTLQLPPRVSGYAFTFG